MFGGVKRLYRQRRCLLYGGGLDPFLWGFSHYPNITHCLSFHWPLFILFLFSFFVLSFPNNSIMITYCIQYTFKLSLIFLPIPWQWHCLCCINRPMLIVNEINKEAFNVHNITAFSIKKGSPAPLSLWFYFLSFICRYIVFQTGTLESFRYRCLFFLHNPLDFFFQRLRRCQVGEDVFLRKNDGSA